jgi:Ni/Fe-hydrogenase subunit HybB-like protein
MTEASGYAVRPPLVVGKQLSDVTEDICRPLDTRPTWKWWAGFLPALALLALGVVATTYQVATGIGTWGLNRTVGWAFDITNFVFWIGIGHAGTLISAILFLFRQRWRTSVNRAAEAMTLFAVMCAGIFPIIHMGRPWLFYWLYPMPVNFAMWPQFRSPLAWDVFAVTTYFTVSLVFWYLGLIPDFASLRDTAKTRIQRAVYGFFALGWRGSAYHWRRFEKLYLLLAGLGTPLVFSVHTIVSFDFAVGIIPMWHATIFPPFFVAGAIFAGFAMVIWLAAPIRHFYGMKDVITMKHMELCGKIMLGTGLLVSYGYFSEVWLAWYSQSEYEWGSTYQRLFGPFWWAYWLLILTNTIIPQLLWIRSFRQSEFWLVAIAGSVHIGMWFERYVIILALTRDHLPSSWGRYAPTFWDYLTFFGTIGIFVFMFCLFIRFVPMISITEMRELLPHDKGGRDGHSVMENAK